MIIRLGYELEYEFEQPTPMVLMLGIHSSRVSDILIQDNMTTMPAVNQSSRCESGVLRCMRYHCGASGNGSAAAMIRFSRAGL